MKRRNILIGFMIVSFFAATFAGKIGIIVNKDLYPSIKTSIDQYVKDLKEIEDKDVWVESTTYTAASTCQALKDDLKKHFDSDQLEGAVFIGDVPVAKYQSSDATCVSDIYWMDLNGTFTGGPSTFSGHAGTKEPEIWVSRLTPSVLRTYKGFEKEADAINFYFTKVHKRMTGADNLARKYVIAGQYENWASLEAENQGDLDYTKENTATYRGSCGADWKKELIAGREYGFVYSHSAATMHAIGFNASDIVNNELNCRFFNSFACSNGNYATANMVGLYAMAKGGLIAVGSAKSGSMIPGAFRAYNKPLGVTKVSFGEAWKIWWKEKGIGNISWHYGMNMEGVGNLKMQPYGTPVIKSPIKPATFDVLSTGAKLHIYLPEYSLANANKVIVKIYNMQGKICAVQDELLNTKNCSINLKNILNRNQLAAGSYICKVTVNSFQKTVPILVGK
jgi:hypothetical protein